MKYKFIQAKRKEDIERCLSLRHRVYIEQMNCFKNGNEQDIWDKHSTHFLALDEDNKPIGTIRFIPYNSNGLPLEQYVNLSQYVHTQGIVIYAEISRFITDYKSPPLDRNLIPFGLFKCCYDHAIETKTNDVFATSKINHHLS